MSVAVLCSIYGGWDEPKVQPPQTVEADWILVTDSEIDAPGWDVIVEPRPHLHPCLAAKVPKCLPSYYTQALTTVWMDGSCRLLHEDSLERIITAASGAPLAQIAHPDRDCIYDEAKFCLPIPKYASLPLMQQVDEYRHRHGHPERWGLWATGLIVRHGYSRNVADFGGAWLNEQVRWGYQDQVSQAPLMSLYGVRPRTMSFPLHGNGILEWVAEHH